MLPPAAKILQERDVKNRNAEHDRSLTRRGLRIATIALFINAAALVINAAPKWIELIFQEAVTMPVDIIGTGASVAS